MKKNYSKAIPTFTKAGHRAYWRVSVLALALLLCGPCMSQSTISREAVHPTLVTRGTLTCSNNTFKILYAKDAAPWGAHLVTGDSLGHFVVSYVEYPAASNDVKLPPQYVVCDMHIFDSYCYFSGKVATGLLTIYDDPLYYGFIGRFKIPSSLSEGTELELLKISNVSCIRAFSPYHPGGNHGATSVAAIADAQTHDTVGQKLVSISQDAAGNWQAMVGYLTNPGEYMCDVLCDESSDSIYMVSRYTDDSHKLSFRVFSQAYGHFLQSPSASRVNIQYADGLEAGQPSCFHHFATDMRTTTTKAAEVTTSLISAYYDFLEEESMPLANEVIEWQPLCREENAR